MSKDLEPTIEDGADPSQANMREANQLSRQPFATRRAALGIAAATTAGILADRGLSPDTARAEGVTSVNGKTGVVVLAAANVEAIPSVGAQAVATVNVETKGIPSKALTDEITLTEGQLVLLTRQTTASENGLWTVKGGTTKWTRPPAFASKSEQYGVLVPIFSGAKHGETLWVMKNAGKVVVDTTAQEWSNLSRIEVTRGPGIAYVPPPTGEATKDTANIQAALNEGPGVCQLAGSGGVYPEYISNELTIPTGVILAGRGEAGTIVKLAPSANTALLTTPGYKTYAEQANKERKEVEEGKKAEGAAILGNEQGGIRDLTLDGNRAQNAAPAALYGVLSWFGRAHIFRDFWIINGAGHGLVSNWGPGGNAMEALVASFKIVECNGHCLLWNGPHDSSIRDGNCIGAGKVGAWIETYGGTNCVNVHNYGAGEYCWVVNEWGSQLVACQGETGQGGTKTALWIRHVGCTVIGGKYFNSAIAILLGEAGKEITVSLDTEIFSTSVSCLKIAGEDWYSSYRIKAEPHNAELKSLVEGSFAPNSFVQILSTQAPILQFPLLSRITEPTETTKANTEAIKAILKALGI